MADEQGGDNSFAAALVCSLLVHILVVVLAVFGLPHLLSPPPEMEEAIPVEIVTVSERTAPPPRQIETPPPEEPPPPPKPIAAPAPEPVPVPLPSEPRKPEPKAEPVPVPVPAPKPKPPEPELPKPPPALLRDIKPPPKKPPPPPDDFDKLLKSVDKMRQPAAPSAPPAPNAATKAVPSPLSERASQPTISERDFVAAQIWPLWNVDLGAKGADTLVVAVKISVLPDGTVTRADLDVDQARYAGDTFFRAAADAARRAVLEASPLKAPLSRPDLYRSNPSMTINFDPRSLKR